MAVRKKTSTTSTEDSLLEHHCLECSSVCSLVCLSPSCHHTWQCGRLHARLSVWSRCLKWRRGRRRDRCRYCHLEIVVGVVRKRCGRYVTTLVTAPGLEPPCCSTRVDWTCRPDWLCPLVTTFVIALPHDLCDTGEVLVPYLSYLLELVGRTSITYKFVTRTVTGVGVTNAPRPPDVTRGHIVNALSRWTASRRWATSARWTMSTRWAAAPSSPVTSPEGRTWGRAGPRHGCCYEMTSRQCSDDPLLWNRTCMNCL